jgi:hypothetical protein
VDAPNGTTWTAGYAYLVVFKLPGSGNRQFRLTCGSDVYNLGSSQGQPPVAISVPAEAKPATGCKLTVLNANGNTLLGGMVGTITIVAPPNTTAPASVRIVLAGTVEEFEAKRDEFVTFFANKLGIDKKNIVLIVKAGSVVVDVKVAGGDAAQQAKQLAQIEQIASQPAAKEAFKIESASTRTVEQEKPVTTPAPTPVTPKAKISGSGAVMVAYTLLFLMAVVQLL